MCVIALGGCAGDGRDPPPAPIADTRPITNETRRARCDVGARPPYFVPSGPAGRLALIGCARLGVSGKRVEFSGSVERIGRRRHSCIHPTSFGRTHFIPAICALEPPLARFAIREASTPQQGVRGYGEVVWGTAGNADSVVVHYEGGSAKAAVLHVPEQLARRFREPPFRLFVAELPPKAICSLVTVTTDGASRTVVPSTRWCLPPTACRTARPGFSPPGHVTNLSARRPCLP